MQTCYARADEYLVTSDGAELSQIVVGHFAKAAIPYVKLAGILPSEDFFSILKGSKIINVNVDRRSLGRGELVLI
jgi:hypothetical protein